MCFIKYEVCLGNVSVKCLEGELFKILCEIFYNLFNE